jgi:hypothetical protein
MDVTNIDKAQAILGEHTNNYVILVQSVDNPMSYEIRFSDPYSAKGLLDCAVKYHDSFLSGGDETQYEWEWAEEDEEESEE